MLTACTAADECLRLLRERPVVPHNGERINPAVRDLYVARGAHEHRPSVADTHGEGDRAARRNFTRPRFDPRVRTAPHGDPMAGRPRYFEHVDGDLHMLIRLAPGAKVPRFWTAEPQEVGDGCLTEDAFWRQVRADYDRHKAFE